MDMKQWTALIVLLLSVDYSRASFRYGGDAREEEEVDFSEYGNFRGWDRCSSPLRDWIESKCDGIRSSLRSELGSRCPLKGGRSIEDFEMSEMYAEGYHSFELAEPCHCRVDRGGSALVHFVISFEELVTSFLLEAPEGGGILGDFASIIFRILGRHFDNERIRVAFPRFQIHCVLNGQLGARGLVLKDFRIRQPRGKINFLTKALVQHAKYLEGWFKKPLGFVINIFLKSKFRGIFESGIKQWKLDKKLFRVSGSHLGGKLGGQHGLDGGIGGIIAKGGHGGKKLNDRGGDEEFTSQLGDGQGGLKGLRRRGKGRGSRNGLGGKDDLSDEDIASGNGRKGKMGAPFGRIGSKRGSRSGKGDRVDEDSVENDGRGGNKPKLGDSLGGRMDGNDDEVDSTEIDVDGDARSRFKGSQGEQNHENGSKFRRGGQVVGLEKGHGGKKYEDSDEVDEGIELGKDTLGSDEGLDGGKQSDIPNNQHRDDNGDDGDDDDDDDDSRQDVGIRGSRSKIGNQGSEDELGDGTETKERSKNKRGSSSERGRRNDGGDDLSEGDSNGTEHIGSQTDNGNGQGEKEYSVENVQNENIKSEKIELEQYNEEEYDVDEETESGISNEGSNISGDDDEEDSDETNENGGKVLGGETGGEGHGGKGKGRKGPGGKAEGGKLGSKIVGDNDNEDSDEEGRKGGKRLGNGKEGNGQGGKGKVGKLGSNIKGDDGDKDSDAVHEKGSKLLEGGKGGKEHGGKRHGGKGKGEGKGKIGNLGSNIKGDDGDEDSDVVHEKRDKVLEEGKGGKGHGDKGHGDKGQGVKGKVGKLGSNVKGDDSDEDSDGIHEKGGKLLEGGKGGKGHGGKGKGGGKGGKGEGKGKVEKLGSSIKRDDGDKDSDVEGGKSDKKHDDKKERNDNGEGEGIGSGLSGKGQGDEKVGSGKDEVNYAGIRKGNGGGKSGEDLKSEGEDQDSGEDSDEDIDVSANGSRNQRSGRNSKSGGYDGSSDQEYVSYEYESNSDYSSKSDYSYEFYSDEYSDEEIDDDQK